MNFEEFSDNIKTKPRKLTQRTYDHSMHEHGTETWLLLKSAHNIKFFAISPEEYNNKEEFSAYCTHSDKVKCNHSSDGYSLEIEYHVSGDHRFTTFFFTD